MAWGDEPVEDVVDAEIISETRRGAPLAAEDEPIEPTLRDVPASSIMPQGERYVAAVGKGMTDIARGTKQRALEFGKLAGLVTPEEMAAYQATLAESRRLDEPLMRDWSGIAGSIYGQALPTAFLPIAGARGAMGAGAGLGFVQPTAEDESAWLNAALGGAGGLAAYGLASGTGKLINALRGRFTDPRTAQLLEAAKVEEVPLSVGDVTKGPLMRKLEADLSTIPGSGRGGFLERQAKAVQQMLERARSRFASGQPDEGRAMLESMVKRYNEAVDIGGEKFNAVGKLAQQEGVGPVPLDTVGDRAMRLLTEYPDALDKLRLAKSTKEILDQASISGPLGRAVEVPFEKARQLEKALGSLSAQARKQFGAGQINDEEYRGVQAIYGGLADDLERWGANVENQAVKAALEDAKGFWKANVLPYREHPVVGSIFKPGTDVATTVAETLDPSKVTERFLKQGRPELARSAMELMAPEGRAAARGAVASRILDPALDPTLQAGVSTRAFETGAAKMGDLLPEVFSPTELDYLARIGQVAGAAERAPGYLAQPPTGRQLSSGMLGALAAFNPLAAIKLLGGARGANVLLSSPAMTRFAAASPRTAMQPALTAMGASAGRPQLYEDLGIGP